MQGYPNLPAPEWVSKQTTVLGGDVMILGLTPVQAEEIVRFAHENKAGGSGHNTIKVQTENPLTPRERCKLSNGFEIPDGSVEVYLGHTTNCHEALYLLLGIPLKN